MGAGDVAVRASRHSSRMAIGGVEGDVIKKEAKPAVRNAGVMQVRYRSKLGCLRFS